MKWMKFVWVPVVLIGLGVAAGCSDDDDDNGTNPPPPVNEFEIVRQAFDNYLSSSPTPVVSAETVFNKLAEANPPYVLSVRAPADYALGHVPGAENIPWKSIVVTDNLNQLPPKTDDFYVYCYTGHTGQIAATVLRALGWKATNMKWGIMGWTLDDAVMGTAARFSEDAVQDYPTETTPHTLATTYAFPTVENTESSDSYAIVLAAAADFLATTAPTIEADAVFAELNDGDATDDPIIISVRTADHYALGHIPGAYNIPYTQIAKTVNLEKLPPNKKIVVYCYTGHTAQIAQTVLGMLGYDVQNMKFGICAWTKDATVRATAPYSDPGQQRDYVYETGSGK